MKLSIERKLHARLPYWTAQTSCIRCISKERSAYSRTGHSNMRLRGNTYLLLPQGETLELQTPGNTCGDRIQVTYARDLAQATFNHHPFLWWSPCSVHRSVIREQLELSVIRSRAGTGQSTHNSGSLDAIPRGEQLGIVAAVMPFA